MYFGDAADTFSDGLLCYWHFIQCRVHFSQVSVRRESTALILFIEINKRHSKSVTTKLNYSKHKGFCYLTRFLLLSQ